MASGGGLGHLAKKLINNVKNYKEQKKIAKEEKQKEQEGSLNHLIIEPSNYWTSH